MILSLGWLFQPPENFPAYVLGLTVPSLIFGAVFLVQHALTGFFNRNALARSYAIERMDREATEKRIRFASPDEHWRTLQWYITCAVGHRYSLNLSTWIGRNAVDRVAEVVGCPWCTRNAPPVAMTDDDAAAAGATLEDMAKGLQAQ